MKKIFLFLMASVGLVAQTPYAHYTGICEQGGIQIVTAAINSTNKALGSFPGCSVLVYNVGTLVTATLYADQGGTFKFNPFTADPTTGRYDFYIAGGFYDIVNYGASIPSGSFTLSSVGIVNPLQPPVFPSLTVTGSSSSTLATITQSGNGYALGVQSVLSGEFINTSSNGDSLVVSMGGTAGHAIVASQNTSVGTATVLISNTGSDPALQLLGGLNITGAIASSAPLISRTSSFAGLYAAGPAGNARFFDMETNQGTGACPGGSDCNRWEIEADTITESGSQAGSNLVFQRFNDTGALIDVPLSINRATGQVTVDSLFSSGQIAASGTSGTSGSFSVTTGTAIYATSTSGNGTAIQTQGGLLNFSVTSSSPLITAAQVGGGKIAEFTGTTAGITVSTSANGNTLTLAMGGTAGHALSASQNTSGGTATLLVSNSGSDPALALTGGITINTIAGVSCSGTPTSSFASINGIVTHC